MIRNIDRPILYNATTTTFNLKNVTPMSSSPIYNNHSPAPAPHLSPQSTFLHLHCSPHHPTLHPKPYPVTPNSPTVTTISTIPTHLSPVTKRSQSINSVAKSPSFNNPHRSCIPPLLPPKSDKIAWKRINNPPPPPNTPLINFLVGKLPTVSHTIIGAIETGNDTAYLKKLFASINIHSKPHIHSHCIPHLTNFTSPPNYQNPYPSPILIIIPKTLLSAIPTS